MTAKKIGIISAVALLVIVGAAFSAFRIRSYVAVKKIIQEFEERNKNRTVVEYLAGTRESFIEYVILFDDPVDGCGVEVKSRSGIGTLALSNSANEWRKIKSDEKIALNEAGDGVCFTVWQTLSNELEDYEIIAAELDGSPHFVVNGDKRK
ncbi:MAG: hypothetical protein J1E35_05285 [Lachnospiraceae bacterium]|nr:hypothetical protein [Lachnospiraceae bacterium]